MKIRLIDKPEFTNACGAEQMALDEAVFKEYESAETPEYPITLRFYSFAPAAVTFGYFQKNSTLNNDFIKQNGFETVRRITGG
ncbi:MAG TPA: lipoate--protein ligase family protein, partial [Candidatus Wallbacteria bacterium]|nr:lipoate--protein ligase family protein [Candidatus Wallbacteria bacterium]